MRTFIAIETNQKVREITQSIVEKLTRRRFIATWVKPENVHLTLFFLGEITEEIASQICERLKKRLLGFPSFHLEVGGFGYFRGRNGRPRVFWLGVKEDQRLLMLYREILNELRKFSFEFPDSFTPHITIGRVKSVPPKWKSLVSDLEYETIILPVDGINVYSSVLTPDGPIYSVFSEIKFEGG
ncbi:MAG: 2,3-cyclic 3-phosphodiesterase [Thermotogaceae bacterium]|jgi:2'-5' RNA ligase|nr:2,3-cyclic 3-phosphodiesterase [Thermotogaceae bacterium]